MLEELISAQFYAQLGIKLHRKINIPWFWLEYETRAIGGFKIG